MLEQTPAGSEVHLVQGALSDRWSPDTLRRMKVGRSCMARGERESTGAAMPGALDFQGCVMIA